MREFHSLAVSLLLAAGAKAQDSTTAAIDTSQLLDTSGFSPDAAAQIGLTANNLPGFCPLGLSIDTDSKHGGNDCRCSSSSSNGKPEAQVLGPTPDWLGGGNCGCHFGPSQCGCFDSILGWLYGSVSGGVGLNSDGTGAPPPADGSLGLSLGIGAGLGGILFPGQCTVTVTKPGGGEGTKTCHSGDRYCTVTVTTLVTVGGGGGGGQTTTTRTETTTTQPGQTATRTITETLPGQTAPQTATQTVSTTTVVPGTTSTSTSTSTSTTSTSNTSTSSTTSTTSSTTSTTGQIISTTATGRGSATTSFTPSTTGRATLSSNTTSPARVTVNAAPCQTGAMAFGVMLGGAVVVMNL